MVYNEGSVKILFRGWIGEQNNAAIEDDSLAEYNGTTAVDVLTDTD